jgi:parallel beta helix pectate lyase-like protein
LNTDSASHPQIGALHYTARRQAKRYATRLLAVCLASLFLALTLIFTTPPFAFAGSITVQSSADGPANSGNCPGASCRLRDAIAAASSGGGDIINFSLAYPATIVLSSTLAITKSLTINGPGATSLTISGGNAVGVMSVTASDLVTVSGVTIANGSGVSLGGGIYNTSQVVVNNSVFYNNGASFGGGIFNAGTLTITNSTFTNNTAHTGGGIVNSNNSSVSITSTTFYNNNATTAGTGLGGGLANRSRANISNSTFSVNNSAFSGGGISNSDTGVSFITNTTFYNNSALITGGGIYNIAALTITQSTFYGNSAEFSTGGGIFASSAAALGNTLLANSPSRDNCFGTITSLGYNLDNANSCSFAASGDLTSTNPFLSPFANYGGATQTMPLFVGSPAIDHVPPGANGCGTLIKTDQRGYPRPVNTNCDIGAVEGTFYPSYFPLIAK